MLDSDSGALHVLTQSALTTALWRGFCSYPIYIDRETEDTDRLSDLLKVTQQPDGSHLPSLLLFLPWLTGQSNFSAQFPHLKTEINKQLSVFWTLQQIHYHKKNSFSITKCQRKQHNLRNSNQDVKNLAQMPRILRWRFWVNNQIRFVPASMNDNVLVNVCVWEKMWEIPSWFQSLLINLLGVMNERLVQPLDWLTSIKTSKGKSIFIKRKVIFLKKVK